MTGKRLTIGFAVLSSFLVTAFAQDSRPARQRIEYPQARQTEDVNQLGSLTIPDPYRWMEDLDSTELADWVAAENKITNAFLEQVPAREAIRQRLTHLWDFERYGVPS